MSSPMLALIAILAQIGDDPVTILSATADKTQAKAGDLVRVTVKVSIIEHKHLYSVKSKTAPTEFKLSNAQIEGSVDEPEPKPFDFFGEKLMVHEGEVSFSFNVRLGRVPDGEFVLKGELAGQACDDKVCIAVNLPFTVKLAIGSGAPAKHIDNLDEGLKLAKKEGKPVFLEFTGEG